jgi:hypothetical protein
MTRKQITAMLDGLDGVAPSPWRYDSPNREDGDPGFIRSGEGDNSITVAVLYHHADTRHLASCDPSTIRALCELALEALGDRERRPYVRLDPSEYERLRAENERLREALEKIGQKNTYSEMDGADPMLADWTVGYDECVATARAALERKPE